MDIDAIAGHVKLSMLMKGDQMETLTNLPEVQEIEEVRSRFLSVALSLKILNQTTLEAGNQLFLEADSRIRAIDEKLDPKRELAYRAYQEWLKLIKELKEPYLKAKTYLNGQVTTYTLEQEKKRREEEEIARQEAVKAEMEHRKKEEGDRLSQAAELEKAGAHEEAEALIQETVEENQKPVEVYVPPPETPRVVLSGASVKTYYSAKVVNFMKLVKAVAEGRAPSNCLEANMTVLNGLARSLKKEMKIDGVEAVSISSMASTGRKVA
jgi:hypothetical protein